MEAAIKVENLSKLYHIGKKQRYKTARETLMEALTSPLLKIKERARTIKEKNDEGEVWALRDLSFDVQRGEVLGVIGRNGAGKSTLLKVISRITEPTSGEIAVRGRIGSLLEVGTGFHPELTGRENIFLNGAVLGMRRSEIIRNFDAIVAFSEVERFLDTQVKHYSSGMYMRLAFAVAAHLQPEILIVDEVLAVGDVEFQKKCLGRMGDVARSGRTVLFVSHNMGAVMQLCTRALMIENGHLRQIGDVGKIVADYLTQHASNVGRVDLRAFPGRAGNGAMRFEEATLLNASGVVSAEVCVGDDLVIEFSIRRNSAVGTVSLAVELATSDGLNLANMIDVDSGFALGPIGDSQTIRVRIEDLRLYPGSYQIGLFVGSSRGADTYDQVRDCLRFDVVGGGNLTTRTLPRSAGLLFLTPKWELC